MSCDRCNIDTCYGCSSISCTNTLHIPSTSLNTAKVTDDYFTISVIQHTYENTNLKLIKENDIVNIEFDYLARFVERSNNND